MDWEYLLETYGYWAILVGTFLEGETILLLGGFAAQRGYLDIGGVILSAFIGTLIGDQLYFYIGRWHSRFLLRRRPAWAKKCDKAKALLDRYRIPIVLSFRFLYGIRAIMSFAIGMSSIPAKQFLWLNMLGAAIWAVALGGGGYLFGNALEYFLGNLKSYEWVVFGCLAGLGLVLWLVYRLRARANRLRLAPPKEEGQELPT